MINKKDLRRGSGIFSPHNSPSPLHCLHHFSKSGKCGINDLCSESNTLALGNSIRSIQLCGCTVKKSLTLDESKCPWLYSALCLCHNIQAPRSSEWICQTGKTGSGKSGERIYIFLQMRFWPTERLIQLVFR